MSLESGIDDDKQHLIETPIVNEAMLEPEQPQNSDASAQDAIPATTEPSEPPTATTTATLEPQIATTSSTSNMTKPSATPADLQIHISNSSTPTVSPKPSRPSLRSLQSSSSDLGRSSTDTERASYESSDVRDADSERRLRISESSEKLQDGIALSPTGEERVTKDYYDESERRGSIGRHSSEGEQGSSDDEEGSRPRGRRRNRGTKKEYVHGEEDSDTEATRSASPKVSPKPAGSQEDEAPSTKLVETPPEPTLTVTPEKTPPKKPAVHPNTNFDTGSGFNTPNTSDNEAEMSDVRRAQNLAMNLSPIENSSSARSIRTILRGDFVTLEQELAIENKRCRTYVVATDLSEEAVYALEWTIGTILRDGDTLHACYAVDEEQGTGKGTPETSGQPSTSIGIGEGAKAMQEAAAQVEKMSLDISSHHEVQPLSLLPATDVRGRAESAEGRNMSARDRERIKAVEAITNTCVRLLRKTKLVVRVAVEVIYCKSPKHLITEAIDAIAPTLVILGSRGRSALKGVLLGSFSNYLVTKSSVPVMVARKKLKKHAKYKGGHVRLSNNLINPNRRLASAKVD